MTVSQIMEKMIAFSEGNIHDIDHFIRVWTYARTIGELEGLDAKTQYILFCMNIVEITYLFNSSCPVIIKKDIINIYQKHMVVIESLSANLSFFVGIQINHIVIAILGNL